MIVHHALAALAALLVATPACAADPPTGLTAVPRPLLCVTEGQVAALPLQRLAVITPKMRAVVLPPSRQAVEAQFTYLGPTEAAAPLRSGALRRQFGLKLRARDGCNVVYAMWRFSPQPGLVVSVKSNPDQHASKECGTAGYRIVVPRHAVPVAAPEIGDLHQMRAELDGSALHVLIDRKEVWTGDLGPDAPAADGPVGLRSDNARLEIALFAGLEPGDAPDPPPACPVPGKDEQEP